MRIFEYTFSSMDDTPMQIKSFLKKKGFSVRSMIVLKRQENSVTVNGSPVFLTYPLKPGDKLRITLTEETPSEHVVPVNLPLDILFEDEDLLIVNKPAGMPIHPSLNNYDNSLGNAVAWYYAQNGEPFVFRCINRLDRDTSGLTIIAKNIVSAGILSAKIARKSSFDLSDSSSTAADSTIIREYLAIVKGSVTPPVGTIDAPLGRKAGSIIERTVDFEHGEHAVTHYRVLYEKNGHSLVSLTLETGRTHQIRVHLKHAGFPLIGDYLYNPDMEYMTRQALHAFRLKFRHPITDKALELTAPLPADMRWMEK